MKQRLFSFFLYRSRFVDPWIFAASVPLLLIETRLGGAAAILYAAIGVWDFTGRHKSMRWTDLRLLVPCLAFGFYALGTYLYAGLHNPDCLNRMPSHVYIIVLPFVAVGLVLVKQPLKWISLGAKIALAYLSIIALFSMLSTAERVGFGTNPALAVYFIMMLGCCCRFDQTKTGQAFFYLSILPASATATRIALVFYAVILIYDLGVLAKHFMRSKNTSASIKLAGALLVGIFLAGFMAIRSPVIQQRYNDTFIEITQIATGQGQGSLRIRSYITEAGIETFWSAPIVGAGLCQSIANIKTKVAIIDPDLNYYFFHNMVLDVLAQFGLIGFALFCWFCFAVVRALWPVNPEWREPTIILLVMIFIYGLSGSFLSDERMTAATMLIFGALINEKRRSQIWARIRS